MKKYWWIFIVLDSCFIICHCSSNACDGNLRTRRSSERNTLTTIFDSDQEVNKLTYDCHWLIDGPDEKPLYLVIIDLYVVGDCSQTSLTFYEGSTNSSKVLNKICGQNITTPKQLNHTETGNVYMVFRSSNNGRHQFKLSYISKIKVDEPFEIADSDKVGIILAIVLGIVFLGALFVAITWFSVRMYMKCRNKDHEPSELTNITNIRTERMRERTLKDDFDIPPQLQIARDTIRTDSTERILNIREAYT